MKLHSCIVYVGVTHARPQKYHNYQSSHFLWDYTAKINTVFAGVHWCALLLFVCDHVHSFLNIKQIFLKSSKIKHNQIMGLAGMYY